jgi:riboflavin synthase
MYTGIVAGAFPVRSVFRGDQALSYEVELPEPLRRGLQLGSSVSIDGVCQTVSGLEQGRVRFDAHAETLRVTSLSSLREGARVHVERSAVHGEENGGHVISGHVDGTAEVIAVEPSPENHVISFRVPEALSRYVFNKGFIALHGASLTVSDWAPAARSFRVFLIPETLRRTTFAEMKVGDQVNLEIDRHTQVLVDTIERTLERVIAGVVPELLAPTRER